MNKSRRFSIYLLKDGFNKTNSLKEDHKLFASEATRLSEEAALYISDNDSISPWWRSYLGIQTDIRQINNGALVFLYASNRWFVLTFGHTYHCLKEESYEYDFGLFVTLNCIDPKKINSTDVVEPGSSKRQRIQIPKESDITLFDVKADSTILKSLTGKVKAEYKPYIARATGAASLSINLKVDHPQELVEICRKLLGVYNSNDYKYFFPNIDNIKSIKDPEILEKLNNRLLEALKQMDVSLYLSIPEIINYDTMSFVQFSYNKRNYYDDICIKNYYECVGDASLANFGIEDLKSQKLIVLDDNKNKIKEYGILKCLVFDTNLDEDSSSYHLCDGIWYQVSNDYLNNLTSFLDDHYEDIGMLDYTHTDEATYNKAVAGKDSNFICMDKTAIRLHGESSIEPCDLYRVENNTGVF